MSPYNERLPKLRVRVTETRDSGVWVKVLDDNRTGYIRRREISWERRVGIIPKMPQKGGEFDVVWLSEDKDRNILYLSIRRLNNPWGDVIATGRYRQGQSVEGEVVNIRSLVAYVQLEPGIDARVWLKDVPVLRNESLEDVLWVGDKVRGVITRADLTTHQIDLNLCEELKRLDKAENRSAAQLALFSLDTRTVADTQMGRMSEELPRDLGMLRRFRRAISRPERFLVIDDEEEARRCICARLEAEYGITADGVESGQEALAKVKQGLPYGLAIIDLKLKGEHGTQVAERLRLVRTDLPVIFMSSARLVGAEAAAINTAESPLVNKEPDEIVRSIDQRLHDRWIDLQYPASQSPAREDAFLRQLGVAAFARQPLEERLREVLIALRQETKVNQALVLKLDLTRRIVSVVAAEPQCAPDVLPTQSSELYFSPVQDVIEDEQEFRRNDVDQDQDPRFKNFFPNLAFDSCLGIPVLIPDQVTTHALFLLDEAPRGFDAWRDSRRIEQARLAARFLAIAIERSALIDHMQRYQAMYAEGQLLATLTHEMRNKLNGLHAQAGRLKYLISNPLSEEGSDEDLSWLGKIRSVTDNIAAAETEATKLLQAYERLAQRDLESVDVNEIVEQVNRQLAPLADHASVKIILDLAPDLARAAAIQSQIQQVIMNLVLNAIQQIQRKQEHLRRVADGRGDKTCFSQDGRIIIQTYCQASGDHPCLIRVRIVDTGPGIHRQEQERVFSMGVSNRGGAGLGLYISRNLIEMAGGEVSLAGSLMFVGSEFTVDLPAVAPAGERS